MTHERRLSRIEDKVDLLVAAVAEMRRESAVHAAVCDAERTQLAHDLAQAKTSWVSKWKFLLAIMAGGAGSAGSFELIMALL